MGDPRRHPRSIHDPGLRHRLLPQTHEIVIVLVVLSQSTLAAGAAI
jgi:hypothetical protein